MQAARWVLVVALLGLTPAHPALAEPGPDTPSAASAGLTPGAPAAGTLDDRFREALKAAWSGRPDAAWEQLVVLWDRYGVRRPALAYDLGAVALQRGEPARAVYYLRLAGLLGPSDDLAEEIARGLEVARRRLTADAERDVHRQHLVYGSVTGVTYTALHRVDERSLAWGAVGLAALAVLAFAWARGRAGWSARLALLVPTVAFALTATAWGLRVVQDDSLVLGVVVVGEATLHEALDPTAPTHLVPGGTEVQVLEEPDGDQLRVRLPTGRKGWLDRDAIGVLALSRAPTSM